MSSTVTVMGPSADPLVALAARPLYASGGIATVLYWALYTVWIAGEVVILIRSLFRRGATSRDRGSFVVVFGSIFVGFTLGGFLVASFPAAAISAGREYVFGLALALMAAGILLRFYSVIVLGRFFTPVVMVGGDQHVVDTGPYRWIRHPSYAGLLVTITGALLAATNWMALFGLLPILVGLWYRMGVEERALSQALGEAYRRYMARTKRLIPGVY